jgi:hypothetical protein
MFKPGHSLSTLDLTSFFQTIPRRLPCKVSQTALYNEQLATANSVVKNLTVPYSREHATCQDALSILPTKHPPHDETHPYSPICSRGSSRRSLYRVVDKSGGCYHLLDTCSRLGPVSISKRLHFTLLFYLAYCLFSSPRLLLLIVCFNTRLFFMAKTSRITYAAREGSIGRVNRPKALSSGYLHVFRVCIPCRLL